MEYRLGIFGFLHLNSTEYTGNMGLKDQQLALKWIHQNIDHFSGNKHQIVIFGVSAGEFRLRNRVMKFQLFRCKSTFKMQVEHQFNCT